MKKVHSFITICCDLNACLFGENTQKNTHMETTQLTVNVLIRLLGGGTVTSGGVRYLLSDTLDDNARLCLFACSSSESISSCRRRRALFASTFGDSHFDNEFGNIFDTPNFILPINDCVHNKIEGKKTDIKIYSKFSSVVFIT